MARNSGAMPEMTGGDWYRFWKKVDRSAGPSGCWLWTGAKSGQGYGRFKVGKRLWSPHRLVAADHFGPLPTTAAYHGAVVMHTCDNPQCCNPAHLKIGTAKSNARDMFAKGRAPARRKAYAPPELLEIVRTSELPQRALAAQIGMSASWVCRTRKRLGLASLPFTGASHHGR